MRNRLRRVRLHAVGARSAAALLGLVVGTSQSYAQNPNVVEFIPSAEHAVLLPGGQPAVSKYEFLVYQAGAVDPYLRLDLGKPAPQSDGLIRVDFGGRVTIWPLPNTPSEARVVAIGPDGIGVSTVSNSFVFSCGVTLSSTGQLFTAAGGNGSVQVTTASNCGWGASSYVSWITITSGSGLAGSGTLTYTVAANTGSTTRTGTLTIAGVSYTVTQAGSGTGGGSGTAVTLYLSDLSWTTMTNGWGPSERDRSNGEAGASDGRTITLNGRTYAKGLGAHAGSEIHYALNGACTTFQADVGIDDEVGSNGSVVFQVWGDGTLLVDSGAMNGTTPTLGLTALISGVRDLSLVATDAGNGKSYDHADWASARVNCDESGGGGGGSSTATYLSDIPWTSASNGWGPVELDSSNGEQKTGDGNPITLNGGSYAKGLGAHASSAILYALNSACSAFQADVGVDDEVGSNGSVIFQVWADGTKLFDSGLMTGSSVTRSVNVDISGKRELALLITDGGDNRRFDHGDWADARVTCTAPVSSPPPPSTTTTRYLSDLVWSNMTNGWGPAEGDRSNGELGDSDGNTITLDGQPYSKGLGAHANSEITYTLNGTCSAFQANVGVDDEVGLNGSIIFQVWADATKLYDSGVMTGATPALAVNLDVAGRKTLSLVITDAGDNVDYDHGDWANARVTCS